MGDGISAWEGAPATAVREAGEDPRELIGYLESDQLVVERSQPVPRATLSARRRAMLWALRGFALALSAMVAYTFVSQLAS